MDFTAVTAVLGNLKTATDIAKLIKDSDISLDKAETKLKLSELINALADAKLEVVNVREELSQAQGRIGELETELQVQGSIRWQEPLYWLEGKGAPDGPFCQNCYDSARKLIRLQGNGEGWYECKACKNSYVTAESRQRDAAFAKAAVAAFRRDRGY
jgi:hypothetical protein